MENEEFVTRAELELCLIQLARQVVNQANPPGDESDEDSIPNQMRDLIDRIEEDLKSELEFARIAAVGESAARAAMRKTSEALTACVNALANVHEMLQDSGAEQPWQQQRPQLLKAVGELLSGLEEQRKKMAVEHKGN